MDFHPFLTVESSSFRSSKPHSAQSILSCFSVCRENTIEQKGSTKTKTSSSPLYCTSPRSLLEALDVLDDSLEIGFTMIGIREVNHSDSRDRLPLQDIRVFKQGNRVLQWLCSYAFLCVFKNDKRK